MRCCSAAIVAAATIAEPTPITNRRRVRTSTNTIATGTAMASNWVRPSSRSSAQLGRVLTSSTRSTDTDRTSAERRTAKP